MALPGQLSKYKKEYDEEIVRFVKSYEGNAVFVEDMAEHFDVCVDTLYEWEIKHPSFSEAFTRARDLAASKYRRIAADNIITDKSVSFNQQSYMWVGDLLERGARSRRRKYGKILSEGSQAEKAAAVVKHLEEGKVEAEEAHSLMSLVKSESDIIDKSDVVKRMEALEQKLT